MILLLAVLSAFLLAAIAAPMQRRLGAPTRWLLAAGPAALFFWFLLQVGAVANGQIIRFSYAWAPRLDVAFALRLDGLSLLFALLVTGIGALVIVYSADYLRGYATLGRFQAYTLLFMGAMLGVVLADDLISLYVFWELTSISSYLLIGFYHESESSRYGALKALLITAGGGLALLAGLVLLGLAGETMDMGEILAQGDLLRSHMLYTPILLLVLLGAFTKSAQVPFHIWLPDAMQAPAGASAYLHSATMVKAGIYLLARLHPALGGTELWYYIVGIVGLVTMFVGAYLAFAQNDLKALLAYSTISSLGWIVALIGVGSGLALKAAMVAIVAHALYKGALFLFVGIIEHETGTRDMRELGGLMRALPYTGAFMFLALASMSGLPPFLGFVAKETLFESVLALPASFLPAWLAPAVAVGVGIFTLGYALLVAFGVFLGPKRELAKTPHEAPWTMLLAPATLAVLSLILVAPPLLDALEIVVAGATLASYGEPYTVSLALWHGFNLPALMSLIAILVGAVLFLVSTPVRRWQAGWPSRIRVGGLYDGGLALLNQVAVRLTGLFQTGVLRHYLIMILSTMILLVGYALLSVPGAFPVPGSLRDVPAYEVVAAVLLIGAAVSVALLRARLAAIASLGTVGFLMALFFVIYSGPDLALTQLLVETLTVTLLLLVFYFLPLFFRERSSRLARWRDVAIAGGVGVVVTVLTLLSLAERAPERLSVVSDFYLEQSVPTAFGANVVNVILVDFRALDTLGEATVLVIALLGVFGLLKLRLTDPKRREEP